MAKVFEFQLQHQSFQWIFRTDFLKDGLVRSSPCCPRDSQESFPIPQFESINSSDLSFLYGPTLTHPYMTTEKTIALTKWTFVGKVMSLPFKTLSRWNSNNLATWCEELTHLERPIFPWCWERLRAGREGGDRRWDGSMASPTQWTWVWVDSVNLWWIRRPGLLQPQGWKSWTRLNDWTELNWVVEYTNINNRSNKGLNIFFKLKSGNS